MIGHFRIGENSTHCRSPPFLCFSSLKIKTEEKMKIINLREYYPQYQFDYLLEVADEIAFCFQEFARRENAYQARRRRHKAYYSLDRDDGIEKDIVVAAPSPQDIYDQKSERDALYSAILALPGKQKERVYAYFFEDMGGPQIARMEGVGARAVYESIHRALKRLKENLIHNR
jgi:RNA polymerase sigma-70 factor (ECF subfamily)